MKINKIDSTVFDRITLRRIDCNRIKISLFHLSISSVFVIIDIISMICLIADMFLTLNFNDNFSTLIFFRSRINFVSFFRLLFESNSFFEFISRF